MAAKKFYRFFHLSFLFAFLILSLSLLGRTAFSEEEQDQLLRAKVDDKFSSIKKRLNIVSENQQKINAKSAEVKTELDSLGIWIRRG